MPKYKLILQIQISGKDSLRALESLCTAPMDNLVGTSKYRQVRNTLNQIITQLLCRHHFSLILNESGGIEADLTVTRIANDDFLIVTGAAFTEYVLALIKRRVKKKSLQNKHLDIKVCFLWNFFIQIQLNFEDVKPRSMEKQ